MQQRPTGRRPGQFKKREDKRRALLAELIDHLGGYLLDASLYQDSMIEEETLKRFDEILARLVKLTPQKGNILIRFSGSPDDAVVPGKNDYEVICGGKIESETG